MKNQINSPKARLARAEGKLGALSTATERIHSMIDPLLRQHKTATRMIKALRSKESDAFIADNKAILIKIVTTGNGAQSTFASLFPMLASMLSFHQDDGRPSKELTHWSHSLRRWLHSTPFHRYPHSLGLRRRKIVRDRYGESVTREVRNMLRIDTADP